MPVWQSVYEELKDEGFEIISAAQDTGGEAAAGPFFDEANVTYTAIVDVKHTISSLYNLVNVPSGIWVDEEGRIVRINEGAYADQHTIGTLNFGTKEYVPALRDWVKNGENSEYAWSPEHVASKIRQRTPNEARAEPAFKLGAYFHARDDMDRANRYWDMAQELNPDSWNYHRQDWSFLPPAQTNMNFIRKRNALTKPYYAPLELEGESEDR